MKPLSKLDWLAAGAMTALVLAVYLRTLLPGIGAADAADLTTAAVSLGIPHPPGYPLHTLLGWVASRFTPQNPALAVNALSAICSALAGGVLALTAISWSGSRWAGVTAALVLGLDPRVWHNSVVCEVFGLNNLLAALILFLGLRLASRQGSRLPQAIAIALLYGLGAAHHHTLAFLLPATAVLFWRAGLPWTDRRFLLGMPAAFAGGLSPYLYPLIRSQANPGQNWDDPHNLSNLLHLFLRKDYGTLSLMPEQARQALGVDSPWSQLPFYFSNLFQGPALGLLALIVLGLITSALKDRWSTLAVALAWLFTGPVFLMMANCPLAHEYYLGVVERFYVLPQVPLALLAGAGVGFLARKRLPGQAAALVCCALIAALGGSHFKELDQRRNTVAEDYMRNLLATLPENALFLTVGDGPTMLLEYAQFALGERPDVVVLDQDKLKYPWYVSSKRRNHSSVSFPWKVYDEGRTAPMAALIAANYGTRPILLWGSLDPSVSQSFRLLPAGLAQRVAEPKEKPTPEELEQAVLKVWESYEKRSLGDHYNPRRFEYLLTSFYGFPFYNLGGELEQAGNLQKAEHYYRQAIQAAPHYALPHRQLGVLLLRQGKLEGKSFLKSYLSLEPDARDAAEIRQVLER